MLLDKNNLESSIVSYTLDGYSLTAKTWSYENKATILVLDKDANFNQDFYYVMKGGIPNSGDSIESMNAEMFSNPFDAYAKFQDLLNESQQQQQQQEQEKQKKERKIPILLKNKKTNEVEFRTVDGTLEIGDNVLAEGFIVDNSKINLSSDATFETEIFVNGEKYEAILLKLSKLDKDGKDGYFIIPRQPNSQDGDPQDGEPQDGDPQDGEPQDGEPQDGEPQDGEPQDGEPQDGEPQDGEPQDGEPQDGEPQDGEPQDGEPQDGEPQDGDPQDGEPQDGEPQYGEPQDGEPQDGEPTEVGANEGGEPPEIPNEILSDRVMVISEVSGIDPDIVKNNFRNVNLAVNFLSGINFKELQNKLNTNKTAYQLAQEIYQEVRNS
jgi:hypothetical protein